MINIKILSISILVYKVIFSIIFCLLIPDSPTNSVRMFKSHANTTVWPIIFRGFLTHTHTHVRYPTVTYKTVDTEGHLYVRSKGLPVSLRLHSLLIAWYDYQSWRGQAEKWFRSITSTETLHAVSMLIIYTMGLEYSTQTCDPYVGSYMKLRKDHVSEWDHCSIANNHYLHC